MSAAPALVGHEAAVFETFVVPRYLSIFGEFVLGKLIASDDPRVVHVDCRTGYPDAEIHALLRGAHVYGSDRSEAAIELARSKARLSPEHESEYQVVSGLPLPFPDGAFSHGLVLHPSGTPIDRKALFAELERLLAPGGQLLVALPLRNSFQELNDLVREYALKFEATHVAEAIEAAVLARPTVETLEVEVENAGFELVEADLELAQIRFSSGRDFFEDPAARLLLLPDLRAVLEETEADAVFAYVREAIDKYWSNLDFELTVHVGAVSARRRPPH